MATTLKAHIHLDASTFSVFCGSGKLWRKGFLRARSEAYYKCPLCRGKIRIVMTENGRLLILKHEEKK